MSMAIMRKTLSVWLLLVMLFSSSVTIHADESVTGVFFLRNININGEEIVNYNLQYPFFLYNNTTYFPLTKDMCEIMGVKADMNWETRTLKLARSESTLSNIRANYHKSNSGPVAATLTDGVTVTTEETPAPGEVGVLDALVAGMPATDEDLTPVKDEIPSWLKPTAGMGVTEKSKSDSDGNAGETAADTPSETQTGGNLTVGADVSQATDAASANATNKVTGSAVSDTSPSGSATGTDSAVTANPAPAEPAATPVVLDGYNVLSRDGIVYLPLRLMAESEEFGWDIYYDSYYGVCISTVPDVTAQSLLPAAERLYNVGLADYIRSRNGSYTVPKAQELTFMFERAAELYNVDTKLLMAIAEKESTFNPSSVSYSGATGMMQVMPATGARYGLSQQQLLDARISIEFGAMYISERLAAFGGDPVKALSAYNQGSAVVNRGAHSTRYASSVLNAKNNLENFLSTKGYILNQ